jgi:hypothetical protein
VETVVPIIPIWQHVKSMKVIGKLTLGVRCVCPTYRKIPRVVAMGRINGNDPLSVIPVLEKTQA